MIVVAVIARKFPWQTVELVAMKQVKIIIIVITTVGARFTLQLIQAQLAFWKLNNEVAHSQNTTCLPE